MNILLIRPNIGLTQAVNGETRPFKDKGGMEPLQMSVLAALTPKEHRIRLMDDRMEELDFSAAADLVAITAEIYTARRAYEIADRFRQKGTPVILGGIHVSAVPEEALEHADAVVVGDAESVWAQVLEDLGSHRLQRIYEGQPGVGHPGLIPDRSIFGDKPYVPVSLLQYGRGCPFVCSFCAIGKYFKGGIHYREVSEVIREIELQQRKFVFFVDDNINGNMERAKELYRALIPLKVRWIGQSSLDMTDDPELMRLMQKSGCMGLVIGFESISEDGIVHYNKKPNKGLRYRKQIRIIRRHGVHIWASFILGHDHETEQTLKDTYAFARRYNFSFAAFNILMPYPGTGIYRKLQNEKRLLFHGQWWLASDYRFNHAAFVPKNLTPERLTELTFQMRKSYNSIPMLLRRVLSPYNLLNLKSLWFFIDFLLVFRRETLKKQSMRLGYDPTPNMIET